MLPPLSGSFFMTGSLKPFRNDEFGVTEGNEPVPNMLPLVCVVDFKVASLDDDVEGSSDLDNISLEIFDGDSLILLVSC